ncbi:kelch repeat protein [Aureobasidium pullulans]|uniref:Kelch repeat protein n=1 Tax=Aureobasidium pullulans TaxID=5580 RepID=A0A4S9ABX2_AURPU|nr:kelch repeat protein [Aureobasidium pullulans]
MATVTGKWTLVHKTQSLQRSSQTLSTLNNRALIFGGELIPRQPRDNDVYILNLSPPCKQPRYKASLQSYGDSPSTIPEYAGDIPSARVGTASTVVDADASQPVPEPRSYHCMTSDGTANLYVHAGCPTSGRLSDLWSFNVNDRQWTRLASAPSAPRGGTSMTYHAGKLYRMGGFDGKHEIGGEIDIYDIASDTWSTHTFTSDGVNGPGARSVATLLAMAIDGKASLITAFGESNPSALGHAGAGNMLPDSWVCDIETKTWRRVEVEEGEKVPRSRGWFAADVATLEDKQGIIVQGGLAEDNERLDDAWVLSF